ncbi:hypothetical protein IJ384_06180 [bacterium]|nr:hypothetical protein [bacterium]
MLKVDNNSNSIAHKGYIHKSVYKHIEKDLANRVSSLRRKHYTFENIPKIQLNQILEEKNSIETNLGLLNHFMDQYFHKDTYLFLEKSEDKNTLQLKLANKSLPDVSLPLIKKSPYWFPENFIFASNCIEAIARNLKADDVTKNNESDLFLKWIQKCVKPFKSQNLKDKFFRQLLNILAKRKAKILNLNNIKPMDIIQNIVDKSEKNKQNKIAEKEFMNSLKIKQ